MTTINEYVNGNAHIAIHDDGTRVINYDGDLQLDWPLNIDIRLSERCSFGRDPNTGSAVCGFCHESATTDGGFADVQQLYNTLSELPPGIELAVGMNQFDARFIEFIQQCSSTGWIVNCTVNQGHLGRDWDAIQQLIVSGHIRGLGVSYRAGFRPIPTEVLEYPNTVVHVIAGIDHIEDVASLATRGVRKILVLGEKDFGFNLGKVRLTTQVHRDWYFKIHELFELFEVISFDNLALEQLQVRRFVVNWDTIYQGEHSFYINAV